MAEEEKERIVIPDEDGNEHLFDMLFTFDVDDTGYSYMVLTAAGEQESEDEEVEVFAFRYEEEEGEEDSELSLFPIETDEEWNMVEEMVETFSSGEEE
ncbi:uncharacterized protein YrzB (UPF0473 family) [Salibacterium salarium]|uniref:UPF0473 protein D7Z54_04545 n=1 Tax=Salibacterium salarium TaxID=284579 RepID=A0A3R9WVJ4_9BACI|nr:DUF1292 domain-containing protein [Salibacterium salarium]MDQ0299807.1 uncharacterized protein YrzB (UPF0473 family) [Salibacterium salarium]RSL34429.1 DUF1292 domain-containing protein [Salibacterium salarium]